MLLRCPRNISISVFLVNLVLWLSACTQPTAPEQSATQPTTASSVATNTTPTIEIDGSSTVYPITDAVAQKFRQSNPNAAIEVQFSGTTGGFKKFCAGETDVNNASRPISTEEIAACNQAGVRFIELPVAFDALTVVVNPQNTWAQDLTIAELKTIWESAAEGKITNWQQVRASFPNRPLKLYGAGTDSGTYDYFSEVVTESDATRSDYTASEDDNVLVQGVNQDPNALGYFGLSYFEQNSSLVKAIAIDGGSGVVLPSRETVENASYQPLSRPLFVYINLQTSQANPDLQKFMEFYLSNAREIANAVGYAPLPEEAYKVATVHFFKGKVGTAYEGKPQPNLTIAEVLRREKSF